jgi:hypothetical protein
MTELVENLCPSSAEAAKMKLLYRRFMVIIVTIGL